MRFRLGIVGVTAAALALGACGSSSIGVQDGEYRSFASSESSTPEATMVIDGSSLTLTGDGTTTQATIADSGSSSVVCPPDSSAEVLPLDGAVTIGAISVARPGIFGDCGITTPVRVTIVDLDSETTTGGFPFTRWFEMCDVTDPDC